MPQPSRGLSFAKLMAERATTVATYKDGETGEESFITLTYIPYSQALEDEALAKTDGVWKNKSLVYILSRVLVNWDLPTSADDQTPYPHTEEALLPLPLRFLLTVFNAIAEDIKPSK